MLGAQSKALYILGWFPWISFHAFKKFLFTESVHTVWSVSYLTFFLTLFLRHKYFFISLKLFIHQIHRCPHVIWGSVHREAPSVQKPSQWTLLAPAWLLEASVGASPWKSLKALCLLSSLTQVYLYSFLLATHHLTAMRSHHTCVHITCLPSSCGIGIEADGLEEKEADIGQPCVSMQRLL